MKKHERTTKMLAKAGHTEAMLQQLQHRWSVVRAGQTTLSLVYKQIKSSAVLSLQLGLKDFALLPLYRVYNSGQISYFH
jgi:hypothetical protein